MTAKIKEPLLQPAIKRQDMPRDGAQQKGALPMKFEAISKREIHTYVHISTYLGGAGWL